jgi:hypothetical protein
MAVILFPPRQIACMVESAEGTQQSAAGFDSDDLIQVIDPTLQCSPNQFSRDLASRGFGTNPAHYSTGTCELTFSVELAGHTDNSSSLTTIPKLTKLLEACGLVSNELGAIGVASGTITSGPLQHGETVAGGTSGEDTTMFGYGYTGEGVASVVKSTAPFDLPETVTGAVSGASFTTTTLAGNVRTGWGWRPNTEDAANKTLSFLFYQDGQRVQLYGCRGNGRLRLVTHDRPMIEFTFMGIYSTRDASANLNELAADAFETMEPTSVLNTSSTLISAAGSPKTITGADYCWTEATLDFGNNVTVRQCANGANGYLAAVIANRAPTFTINPDDPGVTAYPFHQYLMDGTRARTEITIPGGTGNSWRLRIPHLQASAISGGNRDERVSLDVTYDCTRGQDDGANDSSIGHDNEFFLINF